MLSLTPAASVALGLVVGLAVGTINHLLATWGLSDKPDPSQARSLPGRFILRLINGFAAIVLVFWVDGSAEALIAALFGLLFWRNVLLIHTLWRRRSGSQE